MSQYTITSRVLCGLIVGEYMDPPPPGPMTSHWSLRGAEAPKARHAAKMIAMGRKVASLVTASMISTLRQIFQAEMSTRVQLVCCNRPKMQGLKSFFALVFTVLLTVMVLVVPQAHAEQFSITLTGSAQPNCWDMEDTVREVIKNAKSDREKALALHRFGMAHFIHFNGPIEERGEYINDPLKLIAVYGFALCGNNSSAMSALYNLAGLNARVRSLVAHAVPEVWFENRWNYIDTDMYGYVFLPDGHTIASVDDLLKNPDLFLQQKNPPDPFYPFDQKKDMADIFRHAVPRTNSHPYSNAYMFNLELRTGESVTMYYRPQGRYLLTELEKNLGFIYKDYWVVGPVREGSLAWCDRKPASYGNGVFEYKPDLRSEAFRLENPEHHGIAVGRGRQVPPLVATKQNEPASLVVEVNSPWVIVGLQNDLTNFEDDSEAAVVSGLFWRASEQDENRIYVSTDNGQSWQKVWENGWLGAVPFRVDLTHHVNARYSYLLKFEWVDRKGTGRVGLEGLSIKTWVELSPMGLPRIAAGKNVFRLSTRNRKTFYNASYWHRGQSLPDQNLNNMVLFAQAPYLRPERADKTGELTFRLGPKGPIEETRISIEATALPGGKPSDVSVVLALSKDNGRNWTELAHFTPNPDHQMRSMWFNKVVRDLLPAGENCLVKVRISGGGLNKVIANSAVHAKPSFPSLLRVTHLWREGEKQKTFFKTFPADSTPGTYEVEAAPTGVFNEALRIEAVAP